MPIHNSWCACFPASPDQTNGSSVFPGENEPEGCNLDTYFEKYSPPQHRTPTPLGPPAEGHRASWQIFSQGRPRGSTRTRTPIAMLTPTMTSAVSNGSCLPMCTGKVWSESTSEAFQRLCPTTTYIPTTAVGHDRGGRLGLLFGSFPRSL